MTEQDQAKRLRQLYENNKKTKELKEEYDAKSLPTRKSIHSKKKSEELEEQINLSSETQYNKNSKEDYEGTDELTVFPSRKDYHSKEERKKRKKEEKREQKKKRFNAGFFLRFFLALIFLSLPFAIWYIITQEEPVFKEESIWYEKVTRPFVAETKQKVTYTPLEKVEDEEAEGNEEKETVEKVIITVRFHTVQEGETLASISKKYYNSSDYKDTIISYNGLTSKKLTTGQVLSIPIKEIYTTEN